MARAGPDQVNICAGNNAPVRPEEHRRLLAAFLDAAQSGDLEGLKDLLVSDVVSYSDGGGKVRAARTPIFGRARVAQFVTGVVANFWVDFELRWIEANGQASVLGAKPGQTRNDRRSTPRPLTILVVTGGRLCPESRSRTGVLPGLG